MAPPTLEATMVQMLAQPTAADSAANHMIRPLSPDNSVV